jgi:peptidoglycan/xylan/chitin deacetylase (PgdA/CDA1 family)
MNKLPVLMYHRVVSDRCPIPGDDPEEARYAVTLNAFSWQLDRLARYGRRGVSMARVVERLSGGDPVPADWVGITFDDGNDSDYVHAVPLLSERGFTATFFVCGDRVDAAGGLGRGMIAEMVVRGMHVGSHGMTHRFLTALDAGEEEQEISRSRELLSSIAGKSVDHFAPPGGRYNQRTIDALWRHSYRAVCTSDFGFNPRVPKGREGARFVFRRIPVTRATSNAQFDAVVKGSAARLAPLYVRHAGLSWFRRAVGEATYRRLRTLATRR